MGRFFSTIYHTIFVIVSISALVLTIMSATSCAFVKFDHQYKGDGRLLLSLESDNHHRALQDTADAAADATADEMMEDSFQSDMEEDEITQDELADMVEGVPDDIALDEGLGPDVTALTEDISQPAVDEPAGDEPAATTTPNDFTTDVDSALDGIEGPDSSTTMTTTEAAREEDETPPSIAAPSPDDISEDEGEDFSAPTMDEGEGSDETGSGKVASMPEDDQSASFGAPEDYESSNTFGEPTMAGQGSTSYGTSEDTASTEQSSGMYGSSSSTSTASAMDEEAVAQVSGDAGLFCDGERSFSISNLWKGSLSDLENTIAIESDMNSSEELARNAVIMATIFGTMVAFILVIESIVGWTICCEKWIIGLIALCACICQGITFLFFNSDEGEGSDETGSGKVASMPEDDQTSSFGAPEDDESSNTFGEPTMAGQGSTSYGTSEDTASTEQSSGMYGSSSSTSTASAMDEEAVAQVSGDAGLFCDGERSFSISNLWKGSLSDLENTIAIESDMNSSEELARNAVIMATIFGTMVAFILVIESIVGWTICCEKWIIGLIALCACICQGITFLFFNSERYW